MVTDFKIRQGLSTELFEADGITPRKEVTLELGCWYLCTDTVCVYVCVKKDLDAADTVLNRTLKIVNTTTFDAIEARLADLISEQQSRYIEIKNETELPNDFDAPTFNPNIVYYIITDKAAGFISLYVFDSNSQQYLCTNKADMSVLEDKIDAVVDIKLEEVLDEKLDKKVPTAVKATMETQIIFGGNSTATTADDSLQ